MTASSVIYNKLRSTNTENPEMAASLCFTLLFVGFIEFVSADQKNITAESGQNVTLPCRVSDTDAITAVEWSRDDLGDEYVLLYRKAKFDTERQHPSFKNRVDLQDRLMKDGDVSLILKNVMINDTGTYKCHVIQSAKEGLKLINTTSLSVVPPGPPGGDTEDASVGLAVGLSVSAVAVVAAVVAAVVGFLISRKCKQHQSADQPPLEVHV